jgi:hypothetical protein
MQNAPVERDTRRTGVAVVRRTTRAVAVVAAAGTALAAGALGLHARADGGSDAGTTASTQSAGTQAAVPQQTQDPSQGFGFGSNAPSQGSGPPAGRSGGS